MGYNRGAEQRVCWTPNLKKNEEKRLFDVRKIGTKKRLLFERGGVVHALNY